MKKLFSILMMICLIFYSSGYILFYFYRLNSIKSLQFLNLTESITATNVTVTEFSIPLNFKNNYTEFIDGGNELIYFGKVYDIINKYSNGDTLFVTAVYDDMENMLNEAFTDISIEKKDILSEVFNSTLLKSGLNLPIVIETNNLCFYPVFLFCINDKPEIIKNIFLKKITPPPKYHNA